MENRKENPVKHSSWIISAGIAAAIALWLLSGQFGDSDEAIEESATTRAETQTSVRVRTQSAEEVQRTIVVNGKTAPARNVAALGWRRPRLLCGSARSSSKPVRT